MSWFAPGPAVWASGELTGAVGWGFSLITIRITGAASGITDDFPSINCAVGSMTTDLQFFVIDSGWPNAGAATRLAVATANAVLLICLFMVRFSVDR
jgi:hypothetical protein